MTKLFVSPQIRAERIMDMKRIFFVMLTTMLVVFVFAGCSDSKTSNTTTETTVTKTVGTDKTEVTTTVNFVELPTETETETETETDAETETETETTKVEKTEKEDLKIYFGTMISQVEEIPTYESYTESQENAYASDFTGAEYESKKDSRRFFFKTDIEEVMAEYEENGDIITKNLSLEKLDDGLYRVNPTFRMCFEGTAKREYVTFKITTAEGEVHYMTWIPSV